MSFISNASNFTLGDGVYNNVHGDIVYNFYGKIRRREDIEGKYGSVMPLLAHRAHKRRRLEDEDEVRIIPSQDLKLVRQIGSGSGYFLHAGQNNGHAIIVKVFNRGTTVRQRLESTVALSKDILHPNVLRMEGVSSPASMIHFIAYEDVFWKNAEGPLSAALKNDLQRSITLGFKMIEGLSAGIDYLSVQEISLASMGAENFDVFLDVGDRFILSINPRAQDQEGDSNTSGFQQLHEDKSWDVFNTLCQKVLISANRALHNEQINRDPAILDIISSSSVSDNLAAASLLSFGSTAASQTSPPEELLLPVSPRREYVWRTLDRGQQSLATVARRIALDLDMNLSRIHRLTHSDFQNPHRCPGYVREEITLATTTLDSAVVAHDTPSALEICSICHEVVGLSDAFQCICGDTAPGSRHTIKCQVCKLWSHSDCVGNVKTQFTCQHCMPPVERILDANDFLNYLDAVKLEFHRQPEIYYRFFDILKGSKHNILDTSETAQHVSRLFSGHTSLLKGFNIFLPLGYRIECSEDAHDSRYTIITPTGTIMQTANKAPEKDPIWWSTEEARWDNGLETVIQYFQKIKQRHDSETYNKFLDITFSQFGECVPNEEEVLPVMKITLLFKDDPDLISGFRALMPEKDISVLSPPSRSARRPGLRPRKVAKTF